MSSDVERPSPIVSSADELVALIKSGEKRELRVGTEHEKLPYFVKDLSPVSYDAGIRPVLLGLAEKFGWQPEPDAQKPIALKRGKASVTLEPGGQLELSGAPLLTVHETHDELMRHLDEVHAVSEPLGIRYAALGFRPVDLTSAMPWMPKERYRIMRNYLPTRGGAALEMMLLSATVQANFDYVSEADMADKLRTAMGISPIVAALFACSPYEGGQFRGRRTRRYAMWRDVDPDRCGLLEFVFTREFGYRDYVEWALDVPMFFVRKGGAYVETHRTFRDYMQEGGATLADFENHLSTLFPEVRLKTILEVRSADAGRPGMAVGLTAFWTGILYDAQARAAAWALVKDLSFAERLSMQIAVAQDGLEAHSAGWHARDLARELVRLSAEGLKRRHQLDAQGRDETRYLEPLQHWADAGHTKADELLARFGAGPLSESSLRALLADEAW
jgi:glutamate--cysteine ligase